MSAPTRSLRSRVRHGDASCYRYGCDRPECVDAARRARKTSALNVHRGQRAVIPADSSTAHVRRLIDAGMTAYDIAQQANIATNTVLNLAANRPARIYRTTAQAILTIPMPPRGYRPARDGWVDATAATRRIRALTAIGYTLPALAAATGLSVRTVQFIRAGKQQYVRASNHLEIRDVCERLWRTDPLQHGVHPEGVAKARTWAVRQGWVPLACWDDDRIGDPTAKPHGSARTA